MLLILIISLLLTSLNALGIAPTPQYATKPATERSVVAKQAESLYKRLSQSGKSTQIPKELVESCKTLDSWFRKSLEKGSFKMSVLKGLDSPIFRQKDVRLFKGIYFPQGLVRRERWDLLDGLVISIIINCLILPGIGMDYPLLQFLVYLLSNLRVILD